MPVSTFSKSFTLPPGVRSSLDLPLGQDRLQALDDQRAHVRLLLGRELPDLDPERRRDSQAGPLLVLLGGRLSGLLGGGGHVAAALLRGQVPKHTEGPTRCQYISAS